jgi:hypothetical protein
MILTNKLQFLTISFIDLKQITFMSRFLGVFVAFSLISASAFAQTKFTLVNGKEIDVSSYEVKGEWIVYKGLDNKERRKDKYKVFSALTGDKEEIFYEPDPLNEDPAVDWVRGYIKGEQYAIKHEKQKWNSSSGEWKKSRITVNHIAGFATGFSGSILSFYGIVVPAGYATVSSLFPVKMPPASDLTDDQKNSEAFNYGYQRRMKNKRIKRGFLSSMAGFAAGIITFTAIERSK